MLFVTHVIQNQNTVRNGLRGEFMSDKYRMFKNYMYNDLGITKEDIKNWTKEACQETSLKFLQHEISDYQIEQYIKGAIDRQLRNMIGEKITDVMIRDFIKKFKLTIQED